MRESAQTSQAALIDKQKSAVKSRNFSANRYAKVKVKKIIVYKTLSDNKIPQVAAPTKD